MLVTTSGSPVANYRYNAWGALVYSSGTNNIHEINPLRYRGYYYDTETGFYYLQSRYYDPAICRFINADSYASTGQGFTGTNMFAYCNNNCINYVDPEGDDPWWLLDFWGQIHRMVQDHIIAHTPNRKLTREQIIEFPISGKGRADICDPSTGEIWEVKSSGPASFFARQQLDWYCTGTIKETKEHPTAGEQKFSGIFDEGNFRIVYWTSEQGVILYKFWRKDVQEDAIYALVFAGALGLFRIRSANIETAFDLKQAAI